MPVYVLDIRPILKNHILVQSNELHLGLWYPKGTSCNLIGYSNSNFVGCKTNRKSTSGTCHLIVSVLVSWHSKKPNSVTLSEHVT